MDLTVERHQAISHMEKAVGVWAGVNEAIQIRKALSKQHQEPTGGMKLPSACSITYTASCGQRAEIMGQKHLLSSPLLSFSLLSFLLLYSTLFSFSLPSIRPISAKRRASGDEGMMQ